MSEQAESIKANLPDTPEERTALLDVILGAAPAQSIAYRYSKMGSKYRPEICVRYLELRAQGLPEYRVAHELGVVYDVFSAWEKKFPEFAEARKLGKQAYTAAFHDEWREAMNDKGVNTGLWAIYGRTHHGEHFNDKVDPSQTVTVKHEVKMLIPETVGPEQWAKMAAERTLQITDQNAPQGGGESAGDEEVIDAEFED